MALQTIIIRHTRENLKKCSLRGLEDLPEYLFYTYPKCLEKPFPSLESYLLLDVEGVPFTTEDKDKGLILVDATWRLAEKMVRCTDALRPVAKRSIPQGFKTAYPRRQDDCPDPEAGLASIEALYIAFCLMGKSTDGLLDNYYWKESFLEKNDQLFTSIL
jgi:pre-rRNA-processing protein TSR3